MHVLASFVILSSLAQPKVWLCVLSVFVCALFAGIETSQLARPHLPFLSADAFGIRGRQRDIDGALGEVETLR